MDFVQEMFNECYVLDAALLIDVSWPLSNKSSAPPQQQCYSASLLFMFDTEGYFVIALIEKDKVWPNNKVI